MISGAVIAAEEWGAALAADLAAIETAAGQGLGQALPAYFERESTTRREIVERRERDDRPTPSRGILCLKDAYLLDGARIIELGLTRVLVSEIDAWSLNQVTPGEGS